MLSLYSFIFISFTHPNEILKYIRKKKFKKLSVYVLHTKANNCFILSFYPPYPISVPRGKNIQRSLIHLFQFMLLWIRKECCNDSPIILLAEAQMQYLCSRMYAWVIAERSNNVKLQFAGAPNDNFRKNICSEDDLRSRVFETFVVKFLACLPLLGFSNI